MRMQKVREGFILATCLSQSYNNSPGFFFLFFNNLLSYNKRDSRYHTTFLILIFYIHPFSFFFLPLSQKFFFSFLPPAKVSSYTPGRTSARIIVLEVNTYTLTLSYLMHSTYVCYVRTPLIKTSEDRRQAPGTLLPWTAIPEDPRSSHASRRARVSQRPANYSPGTRARA